MSIAVIHKGKKADCAVCNPRPKRERKERAPKQAATTDTLLRRQVAGELGEDGTKEQRFQLLEKYGLSAPRIDRRIKKPAWMEDGTWNQKFLAFSKATKGLVTAKQERRSPQQRSGQQSRPQQKRSQGTNPSSYRTRFPQHSRPR